MERRRWSHLLLALVAATFVLHAIRTPAGMLIAVSLVLAGPLLLVAVRRRHVDDSDNGHRGPGVGGPCTTGALAPSTLPRYRRGLTELSPPTRPEGSSAMHAVPAHLVAAADQHRATLRDLARLARDHHRRGCDMPEACAGRQVMSALQPLNRRQVVALAFTAIAMLAEADGEPTDELS